MEARIAASNLSHHLCTARLNHYQRPALTRPEQSTTAVFTPIGKRTGVSRVFPTRIGQGKTCRKQQLLTSTGNGIKSKPNSGHCSGVQG